MITVTTPPAGEPVSPAELKAHLRVTSDEEDDLLAALIPAARERLEAELGVRLLVTGLREETCAPGGAVTLGVGPVVAVDGVAAAGVDGSWTPLPAAAWRVAEHRPGKLVLPPATAVRIDYRAGFTAEASALPASLRLSVLALAAEAYERRSDPTAPGLPGLGPAECWAAPFRRVRL